MTLDEAAQHVGWKVIYRAAHSPAGQGRPRTRREVAGTGAVVEEGVITSVGQQFVFVRYGADTGSKATHPAMLQLLASAGTGSPATA